MPYLNDGAEIVYPNNAAEIKARKIKLQLEHEEVLKNFENEIKVINPKGLKCVWCGELIKEEYHYYCKTHKKVFCDYCAKNFYKAEISVSEAPRCRNIKYGDECIYNKVLTDEVN